jgi:DNA-binding PadR family transcriptional regulator
VGANVNHSVLDVYVLSLIDRGLETPYDLLKQGGVSLGSAIPALRRLETADLVKKNAPTGFGKRARHWFKLSTAGRKLARSGWKSHLKTPNHPDIDAVLRVADVAQHYSAKDDQITAFLEAAASERRLAARSGTSVSEKIRNSLELARTRGAWNVSRLRAEARFLEGLAKSFRQNGTKSPKL